MNVVHGRARIERQLTRQHFVKNDRQRIDVARRRQGFALCLLGAHELGRAEDHPFLSQHDRPGSHLPFSNLGETKVEHLGEVPQGDALDQENVLWLQIAVNDSRAVRFVECTADLDQDGQGASEGKWAVRPNGLVEVLSFEKLHHDVKKTIVELAVEEHLDGIRVRQLAERPRFSTEPRHEVFSIREFGV